MTEVVEIFLVGLMVLAPLPEDKGMQVLLVRAYAHHPVLAFEGPCPRTGGDLCKPAGPFCMCNLEGFDVSFYPGTVEETGSLLPKPEQELPEGIFSGQQPEWLVRMANVDEVKSVVLKPWAEIAGYVSSKTSFGWSRAQNCKFDVVKSRVHKFEFVKPDGDKPPRDSHHQQALSEAAVFDSNVQLSGDSYWLRLTPRGVGIVTEIPFKCAPRCTPLLIGNLVPESMQDGPVDHYGHHFALYRDLLEYPNRKPPKGLIPHRLPTGLGTAAAGTVQPLRCQFLDDFLEEFRKLPFVTVNGPIICPMALADGP